MKLKTVYFLMQTPLTHRDYKRFGAGHLKSRGFDVGCLDITKVLNPKYIENYPLKPINYANMDFLHSRELVTISLPSVIETES